MAKLNYSVIACSGADPDFAATELNVHSPHTRGWQTSRFCEYPQEVIVELARGASISQIQLLSHQHKIATRIELFVGSGSSLDRAAWTRLGYLSLDTNERSRFQARELKSVYVDAQGRYLKLVAHRCHVNHANLFNQVGIIAMNVSMLRSDDPLFVTRDRFLGSMHSNTLIMTFFREIVLQTRVIMLMTSRLASMLTPLRRGRSGCCLRQRRQRSKLRITIQRKG